MNGKREKRTLAMFAAMMLFGFLCICAYVFFGHNWNFAVSQFDDQFGDMESYTVLVYEGTIVPAEMEEQQLIPFQAATREPTPEEIEASKAWIAEQVAKAEKEKAAAAELGQEVPGEDQPLSLRQRVVRKISSFFNLNTDATASDEEVEEVKDDPLVVDDIEASTVDATVEAYEEKGAIPFGLDVKNPSLYEKGVIYERGGKRIGVLSVTSIRSCASVQASVDLLRSLNASLVVAIVDEIPRVAGVDDIDVVIRANTNEPTDWDYNPRGRYLTMAPVEGSVAATIISPSNIVVSKVL